MQNRIHAFQFICLCLSFLIVGPVRAQAPGGSEADLRVTVDSQGMALIKDRRKLPEPMAVGLNTVRFRDVAATIDATSVHFRSLTDPQATVLEQNYDFDLVDGDRILQKYIDERISIVTAERVYEGYLMSFDAERVVLTENREKGPVYLIERGENIKRIEFPSLPGGLLTRPTLVWQLHTARAGQHVVEVSYLAHQIGWHADYNLVTDADGSQVDLAGWVTVENNSGTSYPDARVKLVAGDAERNQNVQVYGFGQEYYKRLTREPPTSETGPDASRALGDRRIYTLDESTTLQNRQIKQIEILRREKIPATKKYLYDGAKIRWARHGVYWDPNFGAEANRKVNVILELANRADANLGLALPKGKCRVYQRDDDGSLEFIGEDAIEHTSRDEKIALYIGDAFDIVGERKQTDFRRISDRAYEEAFEIKVRNHKAEAVTVTVLEKLYRASDWSIRAQSHDFVKLDVRTIEFPVRVEPDGEVTVTYRVRYQS